MSENKIEEFLKRSDKFNDRNIEKIKRNLHQLKFDAQFFSDSFMSSSIPKWFKRYDKTTNSFYMILCNQSYETYTGISLPAYIGREDSDLWPKETALEFFENDLKAIQTKIRVSIKERIKNPLTGEEQYWIGKKYPNFDKDTHEPIGIFAEAIPWSAKLWDEAIPEEIKEIITGI